MLISLKTYRLAKNTSNRQELEGQSEWVTTKCCFLPIANQYLLNGILCLIRFIVSTRIRSLLKKITVMNQISLTRNELYELVWSEPLLTLSKKYNISDNGLRKIWVRMNIPPSYSRTLAKRWKCKTNQLRPSNDVWQKDCKIKRTKKNEIQNLPLF